MKVEGTNQYKKQTYVKETKNPEKGSTASKQRETKPKDTVSLSSGLKDLQLVKKAVDNTPDVRSEKVSELRDKINSGTYKIDPEKIAGKMMNSVDGAI